MSRKLLTSLALAGSLVVVAACSDSPDDTEGQEQTPPEDGGMLPGEDGEMPELPEPDVEDIPDVVASVNDAEISGDEFTVAYQAQFDQMAMQAQMTGEEVDQDALKAQTLETMVGTELIIQDADDRGHEATDEEVEQLLQDAATSNGMESTDELIAAFEEQGMSEDELRQDANSQVLINKVVDDLEVPEPTDDEIEALYEQYSKQQPPVEGAEDTEPPPLEEMRDQLEQEITSQNQNQALGTHVEELREDANVELFI